MVHLCVKVIDYFRRNRHEKRQVQILDKKKKTSQPTETIVMQVTRSFSKPDRVWIDGTSDTLLTESFPLILLQL